MLVRDSKAALSFPNTGYVQISGFNQPTVTSATFTMWVKLRSTDIADGLIFSRGVASNVSGMGFVNATGNLGYSWNDVAATQSWVGPLVPMGLWSLVAIVVTPTDVTGYVCSDGSINMVNTARVHASTALTNLYIGQDSAGGRFFNGVGDEARIWANTALTKAQITNLYNSNIVPTGVSGEWLFNEGAGTTVADTSGNANTGTITAATFTADVPFALRKLVNGNLVKNGDFEYAPPFTAVTTTNQRWIDVTAAGAVDPLASFFGWAKRTSNGTTQYDTSNPHFGTNSLKISNIATGQFVEIRNTYDDSTTIPKYACVLQPSTPYTLTYWMRTNYISGDSADGAYIGVQRLTGAYGGLGASSGTPIKTTTGWTQYTLNFTSEATCAYAWISLRVYGQTGTGTLIMDAWFDDIQLVPTTAVTRLAA